MKDIILNKREKVAKIVQQEREKKKWTQEELAEKVGFSKSTIFRIERGDFSPNADQLYMIMHVLNVSIKINNREI